MSIGRRIANRRKELKITQEVLADRIYVTTQAVSSWEREVYIPETDKLYDIAKALDTTVSWLMEEDDAQKNWVMTDGMFSVENMENKVKHSATALKLYQTQKALSLMKHYHEGQFRKGKDKIPYIYHPLLMACQAFALELIDDELMATILLHDVVEDCGVTSDELDVSDPVREAVQLLTFSKNADEDKADAKKRYFESICSNRIASMVKILDRCNNVSQMATAFSKKKLIEYIEETETYVLPLIEHVRHEYPEYYNAAFIIKYQMLSVIETIKRLV